MITVAIDLAAIAASDNLRCLQEGSTMRFLLQGQSGTVLAKYADGAVDLFPERDTGHRRLLAILQP